MLLTMKPPTENARLWRSIMEKARVVAARRKKSTPDYINELLKPLVDADYDSEVVAMTKERAAESKRKS
jgi:hypothetical protein